MEIFLLYLWTRLDAIQGLLITASIFLGIGALFSCIFRTFPDEVISAKAGEYTKPLIRWLVVVALIAATVPSKQDALFILAGTGVIEVAKSETAGRLASKSVQLIEQTLDGYLKKAEK